MFVRFKATFETMYQQGLTIKMLAQLPSKYTHNIFTLEPVTEWYFIWNVLVEHISEFSNLYIPTRFQEVVACVIVRELYAVLSRVVEGTSWSTCI